MKLEKYIKHYYSSHIKYYTHETINAFEFFKTFKKMFKNHNQFILSFKFYSKDRNDWVPIYNEDKEDISVKTFFNYFPLENKYSFVPNSWKTCFLKDFDISFDPLSDKDREFNIKFVKMYYQWFYLFKNKELLKYLTVVVFYKADNFQYDSFILLKDGKIFKSLKKLEELTNKKTNISYLKKGL